MRGADFATGKNIFQFWKPARGGSHPSDGGQIAVRQIREILPFSSTLPYNYS